MSTINDLKRAIHMLEIVNNLIAAVTVLGAVAVLIIWADGAKVLTIFMYVLGATLVGLTAAYLQMMLASHLVSIWND